MSIELSDALNNTLTEMVSDKKFNASTKIEILRNAFVFYKLMIDEMKKGNKIAIADQENHIIKEIVLTV